MDIPPPGVATGKQPKNPAVRNKVSNNGGVE
jgi:hypothetical protein